MKLKRKGQFACEIAADGMASGRFYEDFSVGDRYKHWPGRTVTEADNIWFTNLTLNTHPIHFDVNYAAQTEFGCCLVNSCYTLALVTGMTVRDTSQNAIANLGWDSVRLVAPVFVGDTLYARTEVIEKRISKTRPGQGIISVRQIGCNQHDEIVIDLKRAFLIAKRDQSGNVTSREIEA